MKNEPRWQRQSKRKPIQIKKCFLISVNLEKVVFGSSKQSKASVFLETTPKLSTAILRITYQRHSSLCLQKFDAGGSCWSVSWQMDSDGWLTGEDTWRNDESLRFRYAQWESSTDGKSCRFKGARQGFTPPPPIWNVFKKLISWHYRRREYLNCLMNFKAIPVSLLNLFSTQFLQRVVPLTLDWLCGLKIF